MIDLIDPLRVFTDLSPESSPEEIQREIEINFALNIAVDKLLSGKITEGELLTLLRFHGVDEENYVNRVEHNIHKAINQGMEFDPNEVKLYLP